MSKKKRDDESFASLFRETDTLPIPNDLKPAPAPTRKTVPQAKQTPRPPIHFQRFDRGELLAGLASGIDPNHLRRLRAGKVPPEMRLDLHGLTAREARLAVQKALKTAWEQNRRCVLVVHGRGLHSEGEAILKAELPIWLAKRPTSTHILAFCSALPRDGGPGATYILLRRQRH